MLEWNCPHCSAPLRSRHDEAHPILDSVQSTQILKCSMCNGLAQHRLSDDSLIPLFSPKKKQELSRSTPLLSSSVAPSAPPAPLPFTETLNPLAMGSPPIRKKIFQLMAPLLAFWAILHFGLESIFPEETPAPQKKSESPRPLAQKKTNVEKTAPPSVQPPQPVALIQTEASKSAPLSTLPNANAKAPAPTPVVAPRPKKSALLAPPIQNKQLFAQARADLQKLILRTGPGEEFPLAGTTEAEYEYPVMDWKNKWFKIQVDEHGKKQAWVKYEDIELLSDDETEKESKKYGN